MSASNSVPSSSPSTEGRVYEPSMEEILASIRRIIADDQSLPGRDTFRREQQPVAEGPRAHPLPEPLHDLRIAPLEPEAIAAAHVTTSAGAGPTDHAPPVADPVSNIQWVTSEPEPPVQETYASYVAHPEAHGSVAAPQYAAPDVRTFDRGAGDPRVQRGAVPEPAALASPPREVVNEMPSEPDPVPPSVDTFDEPIEPPAQPEPAPEMAPLFSSATDTAVSGAFNVLAASRLAANSDEIMNLVRDMIRPLLRNWLDDNLPSMVERMVRDEIERVARGGR